MGGALGSIEAHFNKSSAVFLNVSVDILLPAAGSLQESSLFSLFWGNFRETPAGGVCVCGARMTRASPLDFGDSEPLMLAGPSEGCVECWLGLAEGFGTLIG